MYAKSVILASLAVSAVSALELFPAHQALKRDLVARQTTEGAEEPSVAMACYTALESVYESVPTPPPALVEWEATVSISDPCSFTLPASISSAAKSYESEFVDWYSSHSDDLSSALSQCPEYSSYGDLGGDATSFSDECATATGGDSGSGSAETTTAAGNGGKKTTTAAAGGTKTTAAAAGGTKTTGGSGNTATATADSNTPAKSTNAGARETGVVGVAAFAMAGVLGVVAAL